jgi:rare lipoprotein A
MYAPATAALAAPPLAPPGLVASEAIAPPPTPAATLVAVRSADLNVLGGSAAWVAGSLRADPDADSGQLAGLAGRVLTLQRRGRHGWLTVASTRTGPRGRYRLRYQPHRDGSELVRVSFAGDGGHRGSLHRLGRLNVYRLAEASWYGGGGSLACGGWLTSSTLGVASKTLPCGTRVTLRYRGRTVRVPVIDRGPYVAGREFDLTEATKRALGFEGVGVVWTIG